MRWTGRKAGQLASPPTELHPQNSRSQARALITGGQRTRTLLSSCMPRTHPDTGHRAAQDPSSGCCGVDGGHRSDQALSDCDSRVLGPPCPTSQQPVWGEVEESSWVSQDDLPNRT